jgi:arginine/lysine/ornithine decarboxylase
MNRPFDHSSDPGELLGDLFAAIRRLLSDPRNSTALRVLPFERPQTVMRIEKEFSAVLNLFDNSGSNPQLRGVFAQVNATLASVYAAKDAQFVEGGSSGGNVRLAIALKRRLARRGHCVVAIDRFAHASVIGAAAIADLDLRFMYRRYREDLDVTVPLSAADVEETLRATGADAVWLTAPTYDGFSPNLRAISAICKRYDAILLVDAAWGVLHGLQNCGAFPDSAIACGADASVVSLHKKGVGLSQASAALFNDPMLARYFRQAGDLGLMTTSPLYLLLASVQVGLEAIVSAEGSLAWRKAGDAANEFRRLVDGYRGCKVVRAEQLGPDVYGDPCHVLINVSQTGVNGFQILQVFNGFCKDLEMATRDTVLLLFGPDHAQSALASADLFKTAVDTAEKSSGNARLVVPMLRPPRTMSPREALVAPTEAVLLADAIGRVAAQTIGAYPPGQAIVCLGEEITRDVADYLFAVESAGGRIKGIVGRLDETPIEVIAK